MAAFSANIKKKYGNRLRLYLISQPFIIVLIKFGLVWCGISFADKALLGDSQYWLHNVNSPNLYEITKSYDVTLRDRINAIMLRLKSTQSLQLTFITTFGVKRNMYSGIVQSEVTLDDLFV